MSDLQLQTPATDGQSPKEGIAAVSQTHPPPKRRSSFKRGVQVANFDSDGNRLSIKEKLVSYSLLRKSAKEELLSAVTVAGCMVIALGGVVEVPSVHLPISHKGEQHLFSRKEQKQTVS